ncbi:MAG: insulinase family protein [Chitinivibrionia bacterium]|nr:insulinase family protein [Chitinivibrionia bacterium]
MITEQVPSVRSVSLGVWVDVGSRCESSRDQGVSHLIEHMVFKGTKTRTAAQIAASLESVGGGLNAFTSREQTCFTARFPAAHLEEAVDVVADIVCRATVTPTNLASLENPSDYIHDLFATAFWGGHPLGQPILGSADTVSDMPRARILQFMSSHYRAESVLITATGAVSHDRLVALAKRKFVFPKGASTQGPTASRSGARAAVVKPNDNNQTHVIIGYPGPNWSDRDRMVMIVLSTYLGGGMSSVLFQRLREDRGLAYTIYTFHDTYRDAGIFSTYLATDKKRLGEALRLVFREFERVRSRRLTKSRLDQVKEQIKGQFLLGLESMTSRMNRLARFELMQGEHVPLSHTIRDVEKVTPGDIQELAKRMIDDSQRTVAILGPAAPQMVRRALGGTKVDIVSD